jgi:hypothetical protein
MIRQITADVSTELTHKKSPSFDINDGDRVQRPTRKTVNFRLQVFTLGRSEPPDRENLQPKENRESQIPVREGEKLH